MMASESGRELSDTLVAVWRQVLVDRGKTVTLAGKSWPVRRTAKSGLCQVDFEFSADTIRGLEQNPQTESRWAVMARKGAKIMQFLSGGRYLANVTDGKVTFYGRAAENDPSVHTKKRQLRDS